ncbi:MAG: DUF3168 domain-containing protein [Candidatus Paceibacterota bacterium]|jgi:hypothetical protein
MNPPLFPIVSADSAVRSVLGTNPVRVFPFGGADENTVLPYAVWQVVGGEPENYLGNPPDADSFLTQIDVYAKTGLAARACALALRNALEPHAHIVSWRGESKDQTTGNFRYSFDINFITAR